MSAGAETVLDPGLLVLEIDIGRRNRKTARFVIGRNDHERPRMPVGEIHRSGNRPVEITHLRQDAFGIVIVSPQINLGSFDHQNKAPVALAGFSRQNLQRLADRPLQIIAPPLRHFRQVTVGKESHHRSPAQGIELRGIGQHPETAIPKALDARYTVLPLRRFGILQSAAEGHRQVASGQLIGDSLILSPIRHMGIESAGRSVLQSTGNDDSGRHPGSDRIRHNRLRSRRIGQHTEHTVAGLMSRRQRRTGRCGVRHPVVG